jgi:hypothetical protein
VRVLGHDRAADTHPRPGRRRLRPLLAGAALCLTLTACTAPLPEVTFYADRAAVNTPPTRWCTVEVTVTSQAVACSDNESPRLSVGRGRPVQINVPGAVADQPWLVFFRYRNAAGEDWDARSQVFDDGRLAYTLHPLSEDDQLLSVQVLSGFELTAALSSGVDFTSTQGWELLIDPVTPAQPGTATGMPDD